MKPIGRWCFYVDGAAFVEQRGAGVRCGRRGRRSVRCACQTCIRVIVRELYDGDFRLPLCGFDCFGGCLCSRGLLRGTCFGLRIIASIAGGDLRPYRMSRLPDGMDCLMSGILRRGFHLLHRSGGVLVVLLLLCDGVLCFGYDGFVGGGIDPLPFSAFHGLTGFQLCD